MTDYTFNAYQQEARRTQNETLSDTGRRMHALHGLASEVGEIHALFQKTFQGHAYKPDDVFKEMGDVMWFLSELADSYGATLEGIAKANIEKLKRRYADGFSVEASVNRKE